MFGSSIGKLIGYAPMNGRLMIVMEDKMIAAKVSAMPDTRNIGFGASDDSAIPCVRRPANSNKLSPWTIGATGDLLLGEKYENERDRGVLRAISLGANAARQQLVIPVTQADARGSPGSNYID